MANSHCTLAESALFAWEASRLADIQELDEILMNAMWAIARLADDLPLAEKSTTIRQMT
jgi:hypothetical protein